jgi:hypothetical protein
VTAGALSGALGTGAMDLFWYARYRRGGGTSPPLPWEFSAGLDSWEDAPAPAQVGKRIVEGFLQRELPSSRAALTNNIVHWLYGAAWGAAYGVVAGTLGARRALLGLPFGASVWTSGYVALPLAKLYKPMWEYDARTLAKDLSAHLAYGLGTAGSFALLAGKAAH